MTVWIFMRAESVMCNDSNDNKTTHDRCVTPVNYADVGLMYGQIMTPVSRHSRVLASAWPLINFISSQYFSDTKYFPLCGECLQRVTVTAWQLQMSVII